MGRGIRWFIKYKGENEEMKNNLGGEVERQRGRERDEKEERSFLKLTGLYVGGNDEIRQESCIFESIIHEGR